MNPFEEEKEEKRWTRQLLAASIDVECEECRWEIVRSGGVKSTCDYHRGNRS